MRIYAQQFGFIEKKWKHQLDVNKKTAFEGGFFMVHLDGNFYARHFFMLVRD